MLKEFRFVNYYFFHHKNDEVFYGIGFTKKKFRLNTKYLTV